ncbi:MAG: hypothetical protein K2F53_04525 [Rikenellaceae bacterium]|nr:hypothetical protein [Rikenellaceae bacterium]MDE7134375.1 hypothetical protein [Rikenellaceae bacterium]MDE7355510.1 hypothetical protein [Rikenellaceae bacterium]
MAKKEDTEKGFDSIVYYQTWAKMLKTLPDELRLKIRDAIDDYIISETEPTDQAVLYSAFPLMLEQIKKDKIHYAEVCRKKAEAGKAGAKKRWNDTDKKV